MARLRLALLATTLSVVAEALSTTVTATGSETASVSITSFVVSSPDREETQSSITAIATGVDAAIGGICPVRKRELCSERMRDVDDTCDCYNFCNGELIACCTQDEENGVMVNCDVSCIEEAGDEGAVYGCTDDDRPQDNVWIQTIVANVVSSDVSCPETVNTEHCSVYMSLLDPSATCGCYSFCNGKYLGCCSTAEECGSCPDQGGSGLVLGCTDYHRPRNNAMGGTVMSGLTGSGSSDREGDSVAVGNIFATLFSPPSEQPSSVPSEVPSYIPTDGPVEEPSVAPFVLPTLTTITGSSSPVLVSDLTTGMSNVPSIERAIEASDEPSEEPSDMPSDTPSQTPSLRPVVGSLVERTPEPTTSSQDRGGLTSLTAGQGESSRSTRESLAWTLVCFSVALLVVV